MIIISPSLSLEDEEVQLSAIRAQGAGGQNVNKVSSAIHLRFDVMASSLPDDIKQSILQLHDSRLSKDGVIVIKAQQFRTQEANREDAIKRLSDLVLSATRKQKKRKPTKPTRASQKKRLDGKKKDARKKQLRGKIDL
ncbi:alternative ribosome rescue aminoacyl-tRNA hydrolase ArfB [Aestuariibacter salexigens]|uniref:alternative ribosome rescue aminoacyl-tRNA hydrolase ArfB n=1 Tax=Aestuariibacter salexigens TaxID=226010 RepID=UPI000420AAB9|nr:alternative ribosome rescue aminoacyl-tRNA hydrolase ArfB [Aestuariibacter salexigens]